MHVIKNRYLVLLLVSLMIINPLLTTAALASFKPAVGETGGLPGEKIAVSSFDGRLHLWNLDRTNVRNFPKELKGYVTTSPTMVNVNNDRHGFKEIAVITKDDNDYYLNILRNSGSQVSREFPLALDFIPTASPVGFDYDDSGRVDLIIGGEDGNLYLWNDMEEETANEKLIITTMKLIV
ncbi:hypothetical protein [Natroniella sp. ANB-PHB2]|uniref:hypothetical protein n=1 Tax=Natroniella sp. ANB-PHB2 TaxID=3384444 RepID=UPI0038D508C5